MKAKMLLISAFIIALFTFAACSDDQEQTYSCNPQADTWVKKNLTKVRSSNVSEDGCGWVLVMKCNGRCSRFEL